MTEYSKVKASFKRTQKLFLIFIPVWFTGSIAAAILADELKRDIPLLGSVLNLVPFLLIPFFGFILYRLNGFKGPSKLKCEDCGAAAYTRNPSPDWKMKGIERGFHDICPNCGNDNRIDLHES